MPTLNLLLLLVASSAVSGLLSSSTSAARVLVEFGQKHSTKVNEDGEHEHDSHTLLQTLAKPLPAPNQVANAAIQNQDSTRVPQEIGVVKAQSGEDQKENSEEIGVVKSQEQVAESKMNRSVEDLSQVTQEIGVVKAQSVEDQKVEPEEIGVVKTQEQTRRADMNRSAEERLPAIDDITNKTTAVEMTNAGSTANVKVAATEILATTTDSTMPAALRTDSNVTGAEKRTEVSSVLVHKESKATLSAERSMTSEELDALEPVVNKTQEPVDALTVKTLYEAAGFNEALEMLSEASKQPRQVEMPAVNDLVYDVAELRTPVKDDSKILEPGEVHLINDAVSEGVQSKTEEVGLIAPEVGDVQAISNLVSEAAELKTKGAELVKEESSELKALKEEVEKLKAFRQGAADVPTVLEPPTDGTRKAESRKSHDDKLAPSLVLQQEMHDEDLMRQQGYANDTELAKTVGIEQLEGLGGVESEVVISNRSDGNDLGICLGVICTLIALTGVCIQDEKAKAASKALKKAAKGLRAVPEPEARLSQCRTSFVLPITQIHQNDAEQLEINVPVWPAIWPLHATLRRSAGARSWTEVDITLDVMEAAGLVPLFTSTLAPSKDDNGEDTFGVTIHDGLGALIASIKPMPALPSMFKLRGGGDTEWEIEVRSRPEKGACIFVRKEGKVIGLASMLEQASVDDADEAEQHLQLDTQPAPESPEAALLLSAVLSLIAFAQAKGVYEL